ncbi:ABC-type transporter Mla MlaB component [Methylobacter tundripaludum]|uniref:ABC-type transporter Mla MlaB component n=1 Tax=Methylobacter tundripaludum TaxID=173365 RepID=A0A2S6H6Y5_9GAMM|nr:STAS domain-containing protein [Methylobacter tundripaludum]PPK73237.1 ABC-type transporter Mla MlaB component [Methylobacter tundripaludum]
MATSEENDLIGYDPLAWMDGDVDKVEETIDKVYLDSNKPEDAGCDNDVTMTDDYSDDLIENAEEIVILNITKENELVIDEIDSDSVFIEERGDDSMDGEGNWAKIDALDGSGAVAEDSVSEEMDGSQIDLDSTLTIQNVVKLHEKLKNLLGAYDEIEINASDVSSIDTATLQLLVSLKKDEVKLQKKATIIYPSPRFVESAKLLGLLDVLGVHDE